MDGSTVNGGRMYERGIDPVRAERENEKEQSKRFTLPCVRRSAESKLSVQAAHTLILVHEP